MEQLNARIIIRNDTILNWNANADKVLQKGEPCIAFDESGKARIKIGDGVSSWENQPWFDERNVSSQGNQFFEAIRNDGEDDLTAISNAVGSSTLSPGDIAIVKSCITGSNYSYTGYRYDGTNWIALDGNYNAENVYFDEDLMTTAEIGNVTLVNGQATIPTAGKNLKEIWDSIFIKERIPTVKSPEITITFSQGKAHEVGTHITPTYAISLDPGSYEFGPDTGVTMESVEVTDSIGNSSTDMEGSFQDVMVDDATSYQITATASYSKGAIPKTNCGNDYADGQIQSGNATATSGKITGYRNSFWGALESKEETIDSALIRSLTRSGKAQANGASFNISVPVNAMRVIFAYPATLRDVSSVTDKNGMNAQISGSFTKTTVYVEGANNSAAIEYKVYYLDFANANTKANTFSVQI